MAPSKKTAKPACNVTHGEPLNDVHILEDDSLISEADLAAKKTRLINELLSERKKVEQLTKEVNKKIREQVATVTKLNGVVKARDELLLVKEVHLAQHKSSIETYKVRLVAQEETHKAQKLCLTTEHDAATARLRAELDAKKTEAKTEKTKASVSNRDYCISSDKASKLQLDLHKSRKDCDDFAVLLRDTKSELVQAKKSITTISKKVVEQLDSTLAHKERMKGMEVQKEKIKFEKQKESTKSRWMTNERNHLNNMARTEHRYEKADTSNFARHKRKTTSENHKVTTAVARATQAAATSQMAQNDGHFPNPRGVDLERVSYFCRSIFLLYCLLTILLYSIV
jgi:hypothetical protein